MASPPKIRVGLLLSDLEVPRWVALMVERIQASAYAEVVLLVLDASAPDVAASTRWTPLEWVRAGIRLISRRLKRPYLEPTTPSPHAFDRVDLSPCVRDVERLSVVPRRGQWSDRFSDEDVAAIRSRNVDVLVRVGFRILRGEILGAAPHGVWSYHHGDNRLNRGGPAGFWETMEEWPVTGCTLQRLSEKLDDGLVLARTTSMTICTNVVENNISTFSKSLSLLPRELEALHRKGPERYFADVRAREPHPVFYSRRLYRAPSRRELLGLLMRKYLRRIPVGISARLNRDQWVLLARFDDGLAGEFWRYQRLVPPRDRFWADPFPIEREGRYYVFFEELITATNKGHISVMELMADGSTGPVIRALVEDHHLSYPFLLEFGSELYMIPESRAANCVPLYRCVAFPDRWEKVMDLMDGVACVDATIHFHEGRWWLFGNFIENDGASSCDELYLFHAPTFPTRDWTPHPLNPVLSDARRARPAGRLFTHQGKLYRPSQDCGPRYGWGLNLNVVERLSPDEYEERLVTRAEPDWAPDILGVHTFNRAGRLHLSDALIRRRR